jgi:hypothetical protein
MVVLACNAISIITKVARIVIVEAINLEQLLLTSNITLKSNDVNCLSIYNSLLIYIWHLC